MLNFSLYCIHNAKSGQLILLTFTKYYNIENTTNHYFRLLISLSFLGDLNGSMFQKIIINDDVFRSDSVKYKLFKLKPVNSNN